MERVETVIVGGGQAGLATSYHLAQRGCPHVILEQASRPGHVWRDERWDSFTLATPNWATRLPGAEYQGDDPNGFLGREGLGEYFENYVKRFGLPVCCGVRVEAVEANGPGRFHVLTSAEVFDTDNVVIATGLFQKPRISACAAELPAHVVQITATEYRAPHSLPPGAVLVVGSAQTGCQITEELYRSGRQVYLCVGGAGRAPRRYRGKDAYEWLHLAGFLDRTVDKLPSPKAKFAANPHVSGVGGGRTLNLHQFARDGVRLLGRLRGAHGARVTLAADLHENLARADKFESELCRLADGYIERNGLDAPREELPRLRDGFSVEQVGELDLEAAGVRTIVWAAGFTFDFSLVRFPVFDADGFPVQTRGVTEQPGLYFIGLPWLHTQKSGLLLGVGEDADHIAAAIAQRAQRPVRAHLH